MAKQNINVGTAANDKKGDSLRAAFVKVNANFTELYTELGLVVDANLNLGAFEFAGSVMSTTDSTAIVIDQATTVTSNLSVGGDIVPQTANGGDLGSSTLPWRSLYVSNNTIFIGGVPLGIDANGNLTVNGSQIAGGGGVAIPSQTGNANKYLTTNGATLRWDDLSNSIYAGGPGGTRWEFEELSDDNGATYYGRINFPDGTSQYTAWTGSVSSLVNGAKTLSLGSDGALTIPGDIKSNSNINIDINLADSTLRRWQFGEDGLLTFPDGTNQATAWTGSTTVSSLVNGSKTVSLDSSLGNLTFTNGEQIRTNVGGIQLYQSDDNTITILPGEARIKTYGGGGGAKYEWNFDVHGALTIPGDIKSDGNINIDINLTDSTLRRWQFGEDGDLRFPSGLQIGGSNGNTEITNTGSLYITNTGLNQLVMEWSAGNNQLPDGADTKTAGIYAGPTGLNIGLTNAQDVSHSWSFDGDGSLKLPGDIRSNSNINIDINLADSTLRRWQFGEDGELTLPVGGDIVDSTGASVLGGGTSIPTVVTTGAVGDNGASHAKVQFTVTSATTVTAVGVTVIGVSVPANSRITLSGSPGTGSFDIVAVTNTFPGEFYILMPFATNASGTGYGAPIAGEGTNPCLVRGTMITMADMSRVAVENITYNDDILVWNFDLGEFASAKPIWIKKTQTAVVSCLLTFSDDSELQIVGDSPKAHRIFNKEAGKFTYGSMPETPIGTTTFNDQGEEITLISKEWIVGEVEFYNVMTDYHMNLFANSILTSMRYNNVYPITDMKFVKDSRTLRTADDYPNIEERLYRGFRLAEQTQSVEEIETHIQWLLSLEVERETECV